MKRLTKRLEDGSAVMDCEQCELKHAENCGLYGCRQRLMRRLADYEDNEKTTEKPDDDHTAAETLRRLSQYCSLDRLEVLARADEEGRVFIARNTLYPKETEAGNEQH